MVALLLDLDRELLQPRVRRQEDVAHLHLGRGSAADEAPDHLAEEQLGAGGRRVDADPQARHVDALGDHQHRDQPGGRPGREARDPRRRVGGVGVHDVRPLAGDPRQPVGELVRVLLVDRDDQAARVRMVAGPDRTQLRVRVAQDVGDPVALGVERRPQAPRGLRRGQHDVEVGPPHASVADPLHVAAVGVEGHRPADAVDQGLRVAVVVVRARDALVVVGHPRDRRVVRAKRRARQQQPEAGAGERIDRRPPPGRVLAHVVGLVGDQQRRPLRAAAAVDLGAGGHGRVRDRDAVPVTRLRAGRIGPVGLEVDAVAGGVERPLAADVGRRRDDRDTRHAALGQHPVGDVQPEGGLAGGGRGARQEGVAVVGEDGGRRGLLPRAQGTTGGPGRQGATNRGAGRSIDLVHHGTREGMDRARRTAHPRKCR